MVGTMNREFILNILYDLSLTIGGEVHPTPLLSRTLQRFLHHTAFPVGLVLMKDEGCVVGSIAVLNMAIGDHALAGRCGTRFTLSPDLLAGKVGVVSDIDLLRAFALVQTYVYCLRLPVDAQCFILLLSPEVPTSQLPLTEIFQPVLANLARALKLCRNNERLNESLISARDDALADLAAALARSEHERAYLDCLNDTIPDLVWVKDTNGVYLSCNPSFARLLNSCESSIVGQADDALFDQESARFFRNNDRVAIAAGKPSLNEG